MHRKECSLFSQMKFRPIIRMFAFVATEMHLELMEFNFLRSSITLCSEIRKLEVRLREKRHLY